MQRLRQLHLSRALPAAFAVILFAFATTCFAENAASDEVPRARAEQLFSQALRLMEADHCQDAIPLFDESQRLDPAAATLTNLATCYARIGRIATAYRTYQKAARSAILEQKPALQRHTDQAIASLAPKLTRLKIVLAGNTQLPDVRVNGALVHDLSEPIALDPGDIVIEASAPDHDTWRRTLRTMGEGSLMVVEVPALPFTMKPTAVSLPVTTPAPTQFSGALPGERSTSSPFRTYGIVTGGVGITGLTVSAILALSARDKHDDASAYCDGKYCTPTGSELRQTALDRAELATWIAGVGVASLITSVILFTRSAPVATARVNPLVQLGSRSTFVGLEGTL